MMKHDLPCCHVLCCHCPDSSCPFLCCRRHHLLGFYLPYILLSTLYATGTRLPRIYIATLPAKFNTDLLGLDEACSEGNTLAPVGGNVRRNPLGEPQAGGPSWFRNTAFQALSVYVHQQLLNSPLRVMSMDDADIVYIPIYMEHIGVVNASSPCNQNLSQAERESLTLEFWEEIVVLLPAIGSLPHWVTVSTLQREIMQGCGGWGASFFCHELSASFTFTVPEVFTGHHRLGIHHAASSKPFTANTLAVPYFGHIHLESGKGLQVFNSTGLLASKRHFASMIFFPQRKTQLRPKLLGDCTAEHASCIQDTNDGIFAWISRQHDSLFCIQPYGDTFTREAFFDCIGMGGTLPVTFDRRMLANLAFADVVNYKEFTIIMDEQHIMKESVNIVTELKQVNSSSLISRLEALQRVSHVMSYSIDSQHQLASFESRWDISANDDAFSMTVKAVLRNLCDRDLFDDEQCNF